MAKKSSQSSNEFDRLEKLFELMGRHEIAELEWEKGGEKIRLKTDRGVAAVSAPAVHHTYAPAHSVSSAASPSVQSTTAADASATKGKQVVSPFVGTFYRAASPEAASYASEGQSVKRGDVLCIIEAMKLMNEIEAEFAGKIVSILVENGQPVEFGEPLFIIEPA